jgi:glycogen debranching enzyme
MSERSEEIAEVAAIQVQPLQLTIHNGSAMLVTNREGWINDGAAGLYDHDTRYLSTYAITIEEYPPTFLTAERPAYNCAILSYTNPQFRAGATMVDRFALSLQISRIIERSLHEAIEVTSFAGTPVGFRLLVAFECSFEDIFEVRGLHRVSPRIIRQEYDDASGTIRCTYRDRGFSRGLDYQVVAADSRPRYSPNLLIFPITLGHQQTWRAEIDARMTGWPLGRFFSSTVVSPGGQPEGQDGTSPDRFAARLRNARADVERWERRLPRLDCANPTVHRAYGQALRDLVSLRFEKVGDEWYPAAGVPWFNTIFGRDALNTALQCLPLGCPFPRAVLRRLAALQGTRVNTWNDEEPGKIPHEYRVGQLTLSGQIPFNPFYGTVDASLLYVILLAETYRFTGDRGLLEQFRPVMEGCLRWAAEYGDIDGDGFVEYWMRSQHDYHNQAWKDAGDAVVYPDGTIVPDPIAIVEVQGYYYRALRDAAEIYRVLGEISEADAADARAARLFSALNEAYWLPEEQFYAMGLDRRKRPIRTIASNPGQLLWTQAVPPERAAAVAARLMTGDMFCGWGVRTLSRQNPAYAPVMYQRGSVWPYDNSFIALGLKRYGHWQDANRLAEGMFTASGFFAQGELPELWVGFDRARSEWPVLYPEANIPQAWSAGSIPLLLRAMLGLEPDPARRRLHLTPTLPDWLPELTLHNLPFLDGTVDFRVSGRGHETRLAVLRTSGTIVVESPAVSEAPR